MNIKNISSNLSQISDNCDCYQIKIPGRIPSKKDGQGIRSRKNPNSASGVSQYIGSSLKHVNWRKMAVLYLQSNYKSLLNMEFKYLEAVHCHFIFGDRRRADTHNKFETIADLLLAKDVRIIDDDNYFIMGTEILTAECIPGAEFETIVSLYVPDIETLARKTQEYEARTKKKKPKK